MNRSLCLLAGVTALLSGSLVRAQADPADHAAQRARGQAVARAIQIWVEEFARGRIDPKGEVRFARSSGDRYIRVALGGGVLEAPAPRTTTHFSLLQRIVLESERHRTRPVAEALLHLAASAYSRDLYSGSTILVRDLGHFALMRNRDATIWQHVLSVALGTDGAAGVPAVAVAAIDLEHDVGQREKELAATAKVMRRVAAVRLLGMRGDSVFKVAIERCLADPDPRVRLAAAEAFGLIRDLRYVYTLTRQAVREEHPLVVMALLATIESTLLKYQDKVPISRGMNVTRDLLGLLGRRGWRNDMAIVRLVRRYPVKPAIPVLIHTLRGAQAEIDPLLEAVNDQASPILADEIFQTLRQMTGALLGPDPSAWQGFWEREKGRLQLVAPYRRRRAGSSHTRGTFFGIPVVGREVVFVIDSSGSMKEAVGAGTRVPRKGRKNGGKVARSRLDAAKEQMLNAVQGIPAATRYHLVTFASGVRVWNQEPVRVGPASFRRLTEALGRVEAAGGTNFYAALMHALGGAQVRFGQRIKRGVDEVFVLSDGEPSAGAVEDPDEILRLVREVNRYQKIRINTIFTGTGAGARFMQQLAAENFGVFVRK